MSRPVFSAMVLLALSTVAAFAEDDATPTLTPGALFSIHFADMPPTLAEMEQPKDIMGDSHDKRLAEANLVHDEGASALRRSAG